MKILLDNLRPAIVCAAILTLSACGGSSDSGDDDSSRGASTCDVRGPGENPSSGSGTESDPYIITLNTPVGGCAVGEADPGPIYGISLGAGTYTVTQSNGTTDLELYIYDSSGSLLAIIDDFIAGFGESGTASVDAGTYYIEVFSNGSNGPFTLEVSD